MSNYKATIKWQRNGEDVLADKYSRAHERCFIANSVNTQIDIIPGSL